MIKNINTKIIILGAGKPKKGTNHPALDYDINKKSILEWLMEAYSKISKDILFVGGYKINEIIHQNPELKYTINPRWDVTSSVVSFMCANPQLGNEYFVSYSDVVYRKELINKMNKADGDIVLAVDSLWKNRYEGRTIRDIHQSEYVQYKKNRVIKAGNKKNLSDNIAEYCGVLLLKNRAIKNIPQISKISKNILDKMNICDFINFFLLKKMKVSLVDVQGDWAELNAPQDLARFVFGSKGETLKRLSPLIKNCEIGEILNISVEQWKNDKELIIKNIKKIFPSKLLAVRSSSFNEDSWASSNAGHYKSILNIDSNVSKKLVNAINLVIKSYDSKNQNNQILIHPVVKNIKLSGVIFSRNLSTGAPYLSINFDDTTIKTDTVTSGQGENLKLSILHRSQLKKYLGKNKLTIKLLKMINELENLAGYSSLDIEFAIDKKNIVHVLQVRPIVVDHSNWKVSDEQINTSIKKAVQQFENLQYPSPFILGKKTIFGIMPDWNPAEIIGTAPQKLSISLYKSLITDEVWAKQRAEVGYRDVRPQKLMHLFMGHPYIDIRASFNSFIPQNINDKLANKIVDLYLKRLTIKKDLHDKIEFEVAITCLTPSFKKLIEKFYKNNFTNSEISNFKDGLRKVTENIINRLDYNITKINNISLRYEAIEKSRITPLEKTMLLISDCREYGTLPFAHIARAGFVAVSFLRSFVEKGVINEEELQLFMQSLNTITSLFFKDSILVKKGKLKKSELIKKYGHLRPGTYDICSLNYKSNPNHFFNMNHLKEKPNSTCKKFKWSAKSKLKIDKLMKSLGFKNNFSSTINFIIRAIEAREYAKFLFSKNLSGALENIAHFGKSLDISREQLSNISINDLEYLCSNLYTGDKKEWIANKNKESKTDYNITLATQIPPLIVEKKDFYYFDHMANQANFITLKNTLGKVIILSDNNRSYNIKNNIVVLERADPGYDWIFNFKIKGLITCYGGANSHMAIRTAEFGIPAAIGIGKLMYEKLIKINMVNLDCKGKRLELL